MVTLRAYFDDSGNPDEHAAVAIGGYVSTVDGWSYFEDRWKSALSDADVPYFHLKEFSNPQSEVYGHLKADPEKEIAFIVSLREAIYDSVQSCPVSVVKMADLRRFNERRNLNLDPYSVAIYGCLLGTRSEHRRDQLQLVFDKFDKAQKRVALAFDYASSGRLAGQLMLDGLTPTVLSEEETWRTVLPLQASDFVTGEVRRYLDYRSSWNPPPQARFDIDLWRQSYADWQAEYEQQHGKPPRPQRGSLTALLQSPFAPQTTLWDEHQLEIVNASHPNGWVLD